MTCSQCGTHLSKFGYGSYEVRKNINLTSLIYLCPPCKKSKEQKELRFKETIEAQQQDYIKKVVEHQKIQEDSRELTKQTQELNLGY